MFVRALCFIAGLSIASAAYAGAWVLPKGEGLFITQATYYTANHYFNRNGNIHSQPRFIKREIQPFVEYGWSDRYAIGGSFYANGVEQSGDTNSGIADPEIFVRGKLWSDARQVLSLQPLLKLPSYYTSQRSPRAGSLSTDMEVSLLYGRNQSLFHPEDYIDLRLGYRLRNRALHDQIRFDAAAGIKWNERVELVPALRGVLAVNPDQSVGFSENGEQDYSLMKAELKGIYHLDDKQWVEASFAKPVAGEQTGSGYAIGVGFARRF